MVTPNFSTFALFRSMRSSADPPKLVALCTRRQAVAGQLPTPKSCVLTRRGGSSDPPRELEIGVDVYLTNVKGISASGSPRRNRRVGAERAAIARRSLVPANMLHM